MAMSATDMVTLVIPPSAEAEPRKVYVVMRWWCPSLCAARRPTSLP